MAWELLPVNYTDAIWNGLKKYNLISNNDGTISLQDVTLYTHRENSFFGAIEANRMNEALNTIMSMVENGTDLYEAFQNYFNTQKGLFTDETNELFKAFQKFVADLEAQGTSAIDNIKTDYEQEMKEYEKAQQQLFEVWFRAIQDKMSGDVAGKIQTELENLAKRVFNHYYGLVEQDTEFRKDGSIQSKNLYATLEVKFGSDSEGHKTVTEVITPTAEQNDPYRYTKITTFYNATETTNAKVTERFTATPIIGDPSGVATFILRAGGNGSHIADVEGSEMSIENLEDKDTTQEPYSYELK